MANIDEQDLNWNELESIIYSDDNYISVDTTGMTNGNDNDKATMTEEQYNANIAKTAEVENSALGKIGNAVLTTAKDVLETINAPVQAIENAYDSVTSAISNNYKSVIKIAAFAALGIGAYFALGAAANVKKNIKILKGSK